MPARPVDPFSARGTFETGSGPATLYRLRALDDAGVIDDARTATFLTTFSNQPPTVAKDLVSML